jgi:murein L,D-transpeptidase YafK
MLPLDPRRFLAVILLLLSAECAFASQRADRVVVLKKERTLVLYSNGTELKRYKVALGANPVGPKQRQGDSRTPEGTYTLDFRNEHSLFYKSIHISYPNETDRKRARSSGVNPGGDIFLHGLPNGYGHLGAAHRLRDWTDGCVAGNQPRDRRDLEAGAERNAYRDQAVMTAIWCKRSMTPPT